MKKVGKSRKDTPFDQIVSAESRQTEHQKRMLRNRSSTRAMLHGNGTSSSENILIMSVLRRLEGLTDAQNKSQREEQRERKDKIKISPVQLYEKSRIMKKLRYNQ